MRTSYCYTQLCNYRNDDLTYNPSFSTINCGKGGGNTCVKLQSRVTSSGAIVVSSFCLFFLFFVGGLGVDEMAEWLSFLRGQGVAGAVVWSTLFFG